MRRRKPSIPPVLKADINVTPFVDVMLVLLVIFMLGATSDMQQSLHLRLPQGGVKCSSKEGTPRTIIALDAQGDLFLGDEKISKEDLLKTLRSMDKEKTEKLYIKAHDLLPYKEVVSLMTDLAREGFTGLSLMTKTKETQQQEKSKEKTSEDFVYKKI